jgi:hypothetical protein
VKRSFFISLAVVLAAMGVSLVWAQDIFVVSAQKRNFAPVPKSGQTTSYATGDDGNLQKGVAWPTPRFTDNNNGTVTDNLTGLIWTQNANIFDAKNWTEALTAANNLKSGDDGLTDGSVAGDWRLPNRKELESLVDCGRVNPALPAGHPFTGVQSSAYWASTTIADGTTSAWNVHFKLGSVISYYKGASVYVWCVRGGP